MKISAISSIIVLSSIITCGPNFYSAPLLDVTYYNLKNVDDWNRTPRGTYINVPQKQSTVNFYRRVDSEIHNLSNCLLGERMIDKPLEYDRIAVYIPHDWYNSECSHEQLIPSRVDYRLCEAKGLEIKEECRGLVKPTTKCPCVCNVRSAVVDRYVVCTTPNLKLFRAELARLVLYPKFNNPWKLPVSKCLKVGTQHDAQN